MRELLARWLLLLTAVSSTACGLGSGSVTRIADGREFDGRAISADAYAAFARGALLEAKGDEVNALTAYEAALSEDADSPEIHARIGALRCRLARSSGDELAAAAVRSLARATELDPHSSSAWTEMANCAARRQKPREALEAALRAASADPVAIPSALLVSELAQAAGQPETARVWLDELVARAPNSREAWAALAQFAARRADLGRELRARSALIRLGVERAARPAQDLDAALARGKLGSARVAAVNLRVRPGELATQLVERGLSAAASEQAALVLGADPDDANAWVAGLAAADLRRDSAEFERLLSQAPMAPSPLSTLATRLHAELLERVVGPEARKAWLAAQPQ